MVLIKKYQFVFLALLLVSVNISAQQSGYGMFFNKNRDLQNYNNNGKPLISWLPFFGNALQKNNIEYEYPFGVGVETFYYLQKFKTNTLFLTSISPITGDTIHAWSDTLIQNTKAGELQSVIKPNVWIFPFLNIYGIVGYTNGIIQPNMTAKGIVIDFPGLGQQTIDTVLEISDKLKYYGPVLGFGTTLAFAFNKFFILADYHYTEIIPNDIESKLIYHSFSPKVGMIFKISDNILLDTWLGAMYLNNRQTMRGKVKVADISETLAKIIGEKADYEGDIVPVNTWNVVAGAGLEINKHHRIVIEGGFLHRMQVGGSYQFRF